MLVNFNFEGLWICESQECRRSFTLLKRSVEYLERIDYPKLLSSRRFHQNRGRCVERRWQVYRDLKRPHWQNVWELDEYRSRPSKSILRIKFGGLSRMKPSATKKGEIDGNDGEEDDVVVKTIIKYSEFKGSGNEEKSCTLPRHWFQYASASASASASSILTG